MSGYVIAGYIVAVGGLGAYAVVTVARLRRLVRQSPSDR